MNRIQLLIIILLLIVIFFKEYMLFLSPNDTNRNIVEKIIKEDSMKILKRNKFFNLTTLLIVVEFLLLFNINGLILQLVTNIVLFKILFYLSFVCIMFSHILKLMYMEELRLLCYEYYIMDPEDKIEFLEKFYIERNSSINLLILIYKMVYFFSCILIIVK